MVRKYAALLVIIGATDEKREKWSNIFFSLLHPAVRENYIQLPSLFFFCLKKKSFLIDF